MPEHPLVTAPLRRLLILLTLLALAATPGPATGAVLVPAHRHRTAAHRSPDHRPHVARRRRRNAIAGRRPARGRQREPRGGHGKTRRQRSHHRSTGRHRRTTTRTRAATTPATTSRHPATTPIAHRSPLAGFRWYVDPHSPAAQQAAAWRNSDPADAALLAKIAGQPVAQWFGDWNPDVRSAVAAAVDTASSRGAVAQLVAYDIPDRDCGGYSSGGAPTPAAYRAWIRAFAAGIGSHPAVVILEPDALALIDCLPPAGQAMRLSLLADAVATLSAHPHVRVYIDAGHSGWQPASVAAQRLRAAGVAHAAGFSLNVSNFMATRDEEAYGAAVSALLGGAHFVIDTSRNGNGSDGQWCNPPGRALGPAPTTATGDPLVDAFLWVKVPGESDGTCNGGPAAGTWWPRYALELARNAKW